MKLSWAPMGALFVTIVLFILLAAGCASPPAAHTATPVSGDMAESMPPPQATSESIDPAAGMATSVAARTPIPTPTPSHIEQRVESAAEGMGLSGKTFLGLTAGDWTDLAVSLIIIVAGYSTSRLLVNQILGRIVKRTPTKLDDEFLNEVSRELRWLVILFFANYAVSGLAFLSDTLRTVLNDIIFLLALALLTAVALGLIRTAANQYLAIQDTQDDKERLDPVVTAAKRFSGFVVLLLALSIGLAHYGANANALYFTLLVSGLIVSLAARDVIADALSGFIILVDQPFRVGDSVLIKELDTWGDVLDIGARTTRIRTKDNREIIVPNSQVVKSQIVNYNYPDSKYRIQSEIGVAYSIDIELIRKTATVAVRGVKGVLEDEPVDVLFNEFGDSARKIRVRWWIASFHTQQHSLDAVNVALESAFENAKIDMPYNTYALRVHMENEAG